MKVRIIKGCAEDSTLRLRVVRECLGNVLIGSPSRRDGADRQVADGGSFYPF